MSDGEADQVAGDDPAISAAKSISLDPSDAPAKHPSGFSRTFQALSIPGYRTLWFGMLFSMSAMQFEIVARSWLAFDLSGSALILGLVAMARGLPQLVLAPFAGVAADRFDRRRLLLTTQSLMVVLSLITAILVQTGLIEVWQLFVVGLIQGVIFPFTMPTRTAFMSDLVGKENIANAMALDSTGRNMNLVVAPSIAGIMLAINPSLAYFSVAFLYGLAVLTIFRLPAGSRGGAGKQGAVTEVLGGFRYIRSQPVLVALLGMAFIPVLLGMPFQQLLPVFQKEVLDVGPSALGLMYTFVGIGSLVGSLGAAYFSNSPHMGKVQIVGGVLFGLALFAFALSQVYVVSLVMLLAVGFASQVYMIINRASLMLYTDREYFGRVTAIYMMTWSLMPLSLLPMGFIVDQVGVSVTVAMAGLTLALFIGGVAARFPDLYLRRPSTVASGPA